MARHPPWLALIVWIWAASAAAQDQDRGQWHYITDASPFHAEIRSRLYSAGILQEDGRFALMVLSSTEDGALVSVNLPVSDTVSELTSTLVMADGNIFVREVKATQYVSETTADGGSVTYSFGIAPDDIERFMSAELWRVQAGDMLTTFSLDGSRIAIDAALTARDAGRDQSQSDP